jgi:hypothetical protein
MLNHLRYFTHSEIDKEKWDKCINQSPQGLVYALSFYLDNVSPNWNAIIEENEVNYLTVMPLTEKSKYGITFLHQPLFCQQLGIFSSEKSISNEKTSNFLAFILEKYKFVSHYHFNSNSSMLSYEKPSCYELRHTHHLSLRLPYSTIYKNYSADRKLNLKRAVKANLQIIESEDIAPLIDMFEKDIAHKIVGGVAENAYDMLKKIYKELQTRKLCKLLYTKNEQGQVGAGGLFVFYQNQIVYLFNAAYTTHRKENGRTLLIDYVLKNYANSSYTFDFESPEIEKISCFYQSFGAQDVPYPVISYNHLPQWVNILWRIKKKIYKSINSK